MRRWRGIGRQSRRAGAGRACALALALSCAVAPLAAGCGSSESGASSTAATSGSSSTSAISGSSSTGAKGKPREGIIPNGKINYASPPPNAPVQSGLVKIKYHEITIEPDTLRVRVGSTIEWINEDPVQHNVTSEPGAPDKLASGNFGEGHTFRFTVTKPGTIHYKCTNHPATMNGTIEVVQ